jgi:hypothetical protein
VQVLLPETLDGLSADDDDEFWRVVKRAEKIVKDNNK